MYIKKFIAIKLVFRTKNNEVNTLTTYSFLRTKCDIKLVDCNFIVT